MGMDFTVHSKCENNVTLCFLRTELKLLSFPLVWVIKYSKHFKLKQVIKLIISDLKKDKSRILHAFYSFPGASDTDDKDIEKNEKNSRSVWRYHIDEAVCALDWSVVSLCLLQLFPGWLQWYLYWSHWLVLTCAYIDSLLKQYRRIQKQDFQIFFPSSNPTIEKQWLRTNSVVCIITSKLTKNKRMSV